MFEKKKGRGKTSTTILKTSRQKHRSWKSYSNENNGLQQIEMENFQPIKRMKDNNQKNTVLLDYNLYITIT
jgi:hypothetical protein